MTSAQFRTMLRKQGTTRRWLAVVVLDGLVHQPYSHDRITHQLSFLCGGDAPQSASEFSTAPMTCLTCFTARGAG